MSADSIYLLGGPTAKERGRALDAACDRDAARLRDYVDQRRAAMGKPSWATPMPALESQALATAATAPSVQQLAARRARADKLYAETRADAPSSGRHRASASTGFRAMLDDAAPRGLSDRLGASARSLTPQLEAAVDGVIQAARLAARR